MSQTTVSQEGLYMPARSLMDCASVGYDLKGAAAAAERGSGESFPDAQYLYALFLYQGAAGVPRDRKTAEELIGLASAGGSKEAAIVQSEMSRNPEDVMERLVGLRLKGEQRNPNACSELFSMYDKGTPEVKKNHAEAVRWYTVCAEADDAEAQNTIGFMHLKGKGIPRDTEKGLYWLKRAADNGSAMAMFRIGDLYYQGSYDTEQDLKRAMEWFGRASDAGNKEAQYALGCIYSTPKTKTFDIKKGNRFFEKAAEQGHPEAQYQIGMSYAYGEGVERDPSMAVKWLEASAENGYQQASATSPPTMIPTRLSTSTTCKDNSCAAMWLAPTPPKACRQASTSWATRKYVSTDIDPTTPASRNTKYKMS